jgi:hypothetical protein
MFRAIRRLLGRGRVDPFQLAFPLDVLTREAWRPAVKETPDVPPPPATAPEPPPRQRRSPREQDAAAARRLAAHHAELNASRFGGALEPIRIEVSRRLRSRLGYYRLATARGPGLIVISRRHLRRHGWDEAIATLLHEMVHQWQDEQHLPVDHGREFRAKAKAVGCHPRARRALQ